MLIGSLRSWFVGVLGVVATLAAVAVEARTLDEIIASKKLVVGINPTLPPLGIINDKNEIDGFDVDIARRLATMLGTELEIVKVGSPDRIPFVQSGKIDMVMGAMTRTPDRAKVIDFTVPVHTEILGVLTTRKQTWSDWKQLNDAKVKLVQVRGSTPIKFIADNLPKAQVLQLDNYPDAVRAIAQGRADAMIDVVDFQMEHTRAHKVEWKVLKTPVDVYYCSIGVARNSAGLRDWLNVALFDMHRKGVIDEAWQKWFKSPMFESAKPSPFF